MALTNAVSWRSEGIVHRKNEIFLDVVERLSLLVSSTGQVLRSEIRGSLFMKSFLSGMPDLRLGLNDKLQLQAKGATAAGYVFINKTIIELIVLFCFRAAAAKQGKSVEMEDVKFHQCVRLSRFENDRVISFVPPDG